MSCMNCGHCCRLIIMPINHEEFLIRQNREAEFTFIRTNWTVISVEQALKIQPELRFCTKKVLDKKTFLSCQLFDPVSNKCTNYNKRPKICSDFPYYGEKLKASELRVQINCGYLKAHPGGLAEIKRRKKTQAVMKKIEQISLT